MKKSVAVIILCLLLPWAVYSESKVKFKRTGAPKEMAAPGSGSVFKEAPEKKKPEIPNTLDSDKWYLKLSTNVNYYNLGSDFQSTIGQIEGVFGGDQIELPLLTFNPVFSMKTEAPVKRAPTYFLPTGNVGLGFIISADHQLEFDIGVAGMVPLKTIDVDTTMTLTESCNGTYAGCDMARLGFVSLDNLQGRYDFQMTMNEDVWIITPNIYYDYIFMRKPWGRLSAGVNLGAVILATSQKIAFYAERTDVIDSSDIPSSGPGANYNKRILQGAAESNNTADIGPVARLYIGFRPPKYVVQTEIRLGGSYGFVDMNRDVDGSGRALLGDTLAASFPLTSLGFKQREVTRFEMAGVFLQAGIVF